MARNETVINAPPDLVFRTLVQADNFGNWVVGSKTVRGVDEDWPAEGAGFHHAVGVGPIHVEDVTRIVEYDEPRRLTLSAGIGPLGKAVVRVLLSPDWHGTRVVMEEEAESGPASLLPHPLADLLAGTRNVEALRRLKRLVEQPARTALASPPATQVRATARRSRNAALVAAAAAAALGVAEAVRRRRRRRKDDDEADERQGDSPLSAERNRR